jgi:hypothetical protein
MLEQCIRHFKHSIAIGRILLDRATIESSTSAKREPNKYTNYSPMRRNRDSVRLVERTAHQVMETSQTRQNTTISPHQAGCDMFALTIYKRVNIDVT